MLCWRRDGDDDATVGWKEVNDDGTKANDEVVRLARRIARKADRKNIVVFEQFSECL